MTTYERMRADFALQIPDDYNFGFDLVDRRAATDDGPCFIHVPRSGEGHEVHTFGDLSAASNRFANVLRGLGAAKGEFACVVIPRIPAWYQVLVGCMKVGVVAMPGTNLLTAKDLEYRINRARATIAVVTADHADKVESIRGKCPTLRHLILVGGARDGWISYDAACAAAAPVLARGDVAPSKSTDLMLCYFTSGTTSMPKMVPRDHAYALAHTITGRYWQDLRPGDVHWTLTDTGWAKAAWGILFPPMLMGATILLFDGEGFDADLHLRLIARHKVTTFCAPPTVYRLFAQMDLGAYDLSSLRHCIGAGEPLNPEVMKTWKEATGTEVHDGYGQTETVNIVANFPGMEVRPGSMGRPVPGIVVDIVDDDGNVLPDGEVGHIAVRLPRDGSEPWPPGLFHGYYEDDEANARCFHDGWYYTGDTATRDADGYIWFVGRSDDIIGSASYRISPFEVESALIEHPAVMESAVVGKPDPLRGEIVKAYVILAPGYEPSDDLAREIQEFVKAQTAPYKYPREIEFRDELPKTISGKIRRVELRDQARAEAGTNGEAGA
ncbi:MAG: AMP-binding protein [Hyphomicrobiales bacterium]|nr:AMP-binding protein [Hyphomicrobiales bacterium]MCP5374210.1 AMP-binding protein [Hyphomicrobiales bacterium]